MSEPARRPDTEAGVLPETVECPFCEKTDTKLINPFGGQLTVAQYWCKRCRTGFDYIKWEDDDGRD
jgi:transposase-like protein